jgi:protein SCO1/2
MSVSKKTLLMTAVLLAALLLSACGPSKNRSNGGAKRYSLRGKVVSVDKQSQVVNVDAPAIPGFMEAMTMPYRVKPKSMLEQLSPGDTITADLIVVADEYWLENVKVSPGSNPPSR